MLDCFIDFQWAHFTEVIFLCKPKDFNPIQDGGGAIQDGGGKRVPY